MHALVLQNSLYSRMDIHSKVKTALDMTTSPMEYFRNGICEEQAFPVLLHGTLGGVRAYVCHWGELDGRASDPAIERQHYQAIERSSELTTGRLRDRAPERSSGR